MVVSVGHASFRGNCGEAATKLGLPPEGAPLIAEPLLLITQTHYGGYVGVLHVVPCRIHVIIWTIVLVRAFPEYGELF
jgi:hypothetical protein